MVSCLPPFNSTVYVTGHSDGDEEAVQDTVADDEVTLDADTPVGTVGKLHVVSKDPVPAALEPPAFVATTWMAYVVPGLSPVNDAVVPVTVCEDPPFNVTVYVTGQLGSVVDAVHVTVAVV